MTLTSFYVLLGSHFKLSKTPLTIPSPLLVHEGAYTDIGVVHVATLHFPHQYPIQDYICLSFDTSQLPLPLKQEPSL